VRQNLYLTLLLSSACGAPELEAQLQNLEGHPTLRIDPQQTSVSGISSGGYMAVQLHVAYSASMIGAAVFAGGPYHCAQGSVGQATSTCMASSSGPAVANSVNTTRRFAEAGLIDPVAHLSTQRVFLFGGAADTTVHPAVMDALADYYRGFVDAGLVEYERRRPNTAHTFPTLDRGGACNRTSSPYLGRCNYDGAGRALAAIYGPLNPRENGALRGEWWTLRQGDFLRNPAGHSVGAEAYVYVPQDCLAGALCRIHVAFHGCLQDVGSIGDTFYADAGYNEWAEHNQVVMLYPQAIRSSGRNPNACWDWWGYDSADYSNQRAPQLQMVKAMIDHLAGSHGTDAGTGATDAGVQPDGSVTPDAGGEVDAGGQVDAGTSPTDAGVDAGIPSAPTCVRDSNSNHVAAGRAITRLGIAYAVGSNQALGLVSPIIRTSLRRIGPNDWAIGACY
jgi:poly(3-hydroxybutyrate) depolymerase